MKSPPFKNFVKPDRLPGPLSVFFGVFQKNTEKGLPMSADSYKFLNGGILFWSVFWEFWYKKWTFEPKCHFWPKSENSVDCWLESEKGSTFLNATLTNFAHYCGYEVTTNNVENDDFSPSHRSGAGWRCPCSPLYWNFQNIPKVHKTGKNAVFIHFTPKIHQF